MNRLTFALAAAGGLMLSGCIDSAAPILSGAQPVLGQQVRFQFYTLRDGAAYDPQTTNFRWNGALYTRTAGGPRDLDAFSAHAFEGGALIIQTISARHPRITEYALAQKLVSGAYLVVAIDEADADEATRADYCGKVAGSACRIEKRDQLFAFARATAAKSHEHGALALKLPDRGR